MTVSTVCKHTSARISYISIWWERRIFQKPDFIHHILVGFQISQEAKNAYLLGLTQNATLLIPTWYIYDQSPKIMFNFIFNLTAISAVFFPQFLIFSNVFSLFLALLEIFMIINTNKYLFLNPSALFLVVKSLHTDSWFHLHTSLWNSWMFITKKMAWHRSCSPESPSRGAEVATGWEMYSQGGVMRQKHNVALFPHGEI